MTYSWSWQDYEQVARESAGQPPAGKKAFRQLGGTRRPRGAPMDTGGGALTRFAGAGASHAHDQARVSLSAGHKAVLDGTTLFPSSVVKAGDSPRLLVSGLNSAKLGRIVQKGRWRGLPIFHLTLEERATCPRSCLHFRSCYGNGMPMTRRHASGPDLEAALVIELDRLVALHRAGLVVRLHGLGDFYSVAYARLWLDALLCYPTLCLFGYTARDRDGEIGGVVAEMNEADPARCAIRFSGSSERAMGSQTIWRPGARGRVAEGIVCPAQSGDTAACATCGLCWAPAMRDETIVFLGHGQKFRREEEPS